MAIKNVSFTTKYTPKSTTEEIKVLVQVGDANDEGSGYHVFLGTKRISSNEEAILGKASDVIGKTALISAAVPDILTQTNWTSVTVNVQEGASVETVGSYREQASQHLDTVCYTIKIKFNHEN